MIESDVALRGQSNIADGEIADSRAYRCWPANLYNLYHKLFGAPKPLNSGQAAVSNGVLQ